MPALRDVLKQRLSPATVDNLRAVRHASAQALAGADLWHLRVDLERRIDERLRETDAAQDARIMAAIHEELTRELDRWGQDVMDRVDILLGATGRLVASLEERVAELERRVTAPSLEALTPHPALVESETIADTVAS
jgi:hypothetical protein